MILESQSKQAIVHSAPMVGKIKKELGEFLAVLQVRGAPSPERPPPHSQSKKQSGLTVEDARHVAYSKDIYQSNILS